MRGVFLFWLMAAASAFAVETPAPNRVVEIERAVEWVIDAAGHPWMVPGNMDTALKEWDGTKWITHDFPRGVRCWVGLNVDDQGRIWLNTELAPVSIYDPRSDKWQTFPNMEEALLAPPRKPVRFLHNRWSLAPQYSSDQKRMAYRWQVLTISYYNGAIWQRWGRKAITGNKGQDNSVGPPWFDEEGRLRVNIHDGTSWRLDDSGKWLSVPWVSHFPDDLWSERVNYDWRPQAPEGSVPAERDTIVVDNLGITWFISNRVLYKAIPGICVPVTGPDELNPLRTIHTLQDVYVDPQGNAFITAVSSEIQRFMIPPRGAAPTTRVTMSKKGEDSFTVHFDVDTAQPVSFRWKLDGGDWSVTRVPAVALDYLLNGAHVLQVSAVDGDLNMEKVPVEVRFDTHVDNAKLLDHLMTQLLGTDYDDRKTAVFEFGRRPLLALPVLRKARDKVTEDQRWWIDAAIQECERKTSGESAIPAESTDK
jgi:hypothetical protein